MTEPFPIPRQLRQTDVFVGDGGATYSGFGFKVFDVDDVEVWTKAAMETAFSKQTVAVAKLNNLPFDDFSVTFSASQAVTTAIVVRSARLAERTAGVDNGTRLDMNALEKELSKQATVQQEVRRDLGRAVMSDFGEDGFTIDAGIGDGITLMKKGDRLVAGPDIVAIGKDAEEARDIAAGYASDAVSQGNVPIYATISGMGAITVPAGINAIRVNGRAAAGDQDAGVFIDSDNGSQDTFVSGGATSRTWYRAFDTVTQTNPNSPGWGVSFNPPSAPGYSNGIARTYTITGNSDNPVNGWLLNVIVDASYDKDIMGAVTSTPVAVANNIEMQVRKDNAGNDFWCSIGVLDIQAENTGGQAIAGIIRGNWTGVNLTAGLRAQAENYSGRSAYGLIVSASLTDGLGAAFDNAFSTGVFVHMAKDFGVRVGGLQGAQPAELPTKPFVFQTADGTQDIWSVVNNGGLTATMRLQGAFILESNVFPLLQMGAVAAAADHKYWQFVAENDGTLSLRGINDAQDAVGLMFKINRSGQNFSAITFGAGLASIDAAGFVNASSGFRVGVAGVVGPRNTGWAAMTGASDKASVYDASTVTLAQIAGRVKALQDALTTHGLLGA